jgi:hypothetical protein
MRTLLVMGTAIIFTSCAANRNYWAPGPNINPNLTFEQQKAQCSMMARHGGTPAGDLYGAAAIDHDIAENLRAGQDFNDCMFAAGYVLKAGQ